MNKKKTNYRKKTRKELEQMTFSDHLSSLADAAKELENLVKDLVERGKEKLKNGKSK
jgi:hypothetical protein